MSLFSFIFSHTVSFKGKLNKSAEMLKRVSLTQPSQILTSFIGKYTKSRHLYPTVSIFSYCRLEAGKGNTCQGREFLGPPLQAAAPAQGEETPPPSLSSLPSFPSGGEEHLI